MDLKSLQYDPAAFRRALRIDADGKSVRLADVLDPWQSEDFAALDAGWQRVAGVPTLSGKPIISRAWWERARGHAKTADLAVQAAWVLFASRNRIVGYGAAADREQAGLLRSSIETLIRRNAWLNSILKVSAWKIENVVTGSVLEILSSDGPTSYGLTPNFLIVDELTHHKSRELWDSLLSAAAKRSTCMLVAIMNSGWCESWQWETREAVRQDPSWHFHALPGCCASWISQAALDEQRRLLPRIAYERLFLNRWSQGSGDALDPADITAACCLPGPIQAPERGYQYVAGLDLGIARDKAALVVLGIHVGWSESIPKPRVISRNERIRIEAGLAEAPPTDYEEQFEEGTGRLKLAQVVVWNPRETGRVNLEEVERTILGLDRQFRLQIAADVWNAEYLIQRLTKAGVQIEGVNFTGQNLVAMATATLSAFSEKQIDIFPDENLIHDLHNLQVVEKTYGVRLDAPRGPSGHADSATALSLSLLLARNFSQSRLGTFSEKDRLIVA